MCLGFFTFQSDSELKVVVSFNREEYIDRQTSQLDRFEEDQNIIGGRDQKANGSWFLLNVQTGNIAFLTNKTDILKINDAKSRGMLIYDFCTTGFYSNIEIQNSEDVIVNCNAVCSKIDEYYDLILNTIGQYNGFNFIFGNVFTEYYKYLGNHRPIISQKSINKNHLYSICNLSNFELILEKEQIGLKSFEQIVGNNSGFEMLSQLEQLMIGQDVFMKWYMNNDNLYGAKSTSILLIDRSNKMMFREVTYNSGVQDILENAVYKDINLQL